MKRYGQVCPLARGLDVVGDRWSLLVVRELMIGPRRYTDLQDGLPGIGTNVLADRLKDLTRAGIVEKRTLPPPAPAVVYELTAAGRALGPSLEALRRWGAEHAPPPQPDDVVRPAWILMSAAGNASTAVAAPGTTCELRVGTEVFHLVSGERGFSVHGGPAERADARLAFDASSFSSLTSGRDRRRGASGWSSDGDRAVVRAFVDALRGAVRTG